MAFIEIQAAEKKSSVAVVTLATGEEYRRIWDTYCRQNWSVYAKKHGFDIICFTEPLDESDKARSRSPAWQKCLALDQPVCRDYERVVWVDSDILINPSSPSIVDGVPVEKIGAVDEMAAPTREAHDTAIEEMVSRWEQAGNATLAQQWAEGRSAEAYHAAYDGVPPIGPHIVQTGVMVLSHLHREVLRHVYDTYQNANDLALNYEMRPLSYEIQRRGLFHGLNPRFNALLYVMQILSEVGVDRALTKAELPSLVRGQFLANYFLHFASFRHLMFKP
jgi:hypothetical protein